MTVPLLFFLSIRYINILHDRSGGYLKKTSQLTCLFFFSVLGPATVRMISESGPAFPLPLHLPPGHMVQQVLDENGVVTHVIMSQTGPPPPPHHIVRNKEKKRIFQQFSFLASRLFCIAIQWNLWSSTSLSQCLWTFSHRSIDISPTFFFKSSFISVFCQW